jgi:GT2 family glycosyltransferase
MSDVVRIVIGTFGDSRWVTKANTAMASAAAQTVRCDVVHVHADTLANARNLGAAGGGYDWLVFLDADDELDARYVEEMLASDGDLRQPSTLGVYPDGREDAEPVLIPKKRLLDGNYLVVGTMISHDMFEAAGRWGDEPYAEDWALWIRARLAGATVGHCPKAIYRVGVNDDSRNNQSRQLQVHWYNLIRNRYAAEAHRLETEKGWVL